MMQPHAWRWLVLVVMVLAVFDVRLYMMASEARQAALDRAQYTLHVGVDVLAQRLDQQLTTYDRLLSGIGEAVRLRGRISDTPDLTMHRLLLRRHAINPELRSFFLVRETGVMAEVSTAYPLKEVDVSGRDYFLAQSGSGADEDRLFVGQPIVSKLTGQYIVPLSRRVENEGSRFLGVVAAAVDPGMLTKMLAEQGLPDGYVLSVFLQSGQGMACYPARVDCLQRKVDHTPLFRSLLPAEARGQFAHQTLLDETPGLAAYTTSSRYRLVVAATVDEKTVLVPWRRDLGNYVLIAIAGNLIVAGLAWFAVNQVQRRRLALLQLAHANQELEDRVLQRTQQLKRSEDRARTFMNTARDGVVVIDSNSCIVEFNRAAENLFGYSLKEVLGRKIDMLMPQQFGAEHRDYVQAANGATGVRSGSRGREVTGLHKDGHEFPIDVTVGSSGEGGQSFHVGIIRDISERKRLERELQQQAATDGLTGVLNRRAFTAKSEELIAVALRHDRPLSLLVIDVDHFKKVNDVHGHPAGDAVLRALARMLGAALRTGDVLGRLGGEEFAIVLSETDEAGARDAGERLLQVVRAARIDHEGTALHITVSIGAAVLRAGEDGFAALFARADRALYRAKNSGRDRLALERAEDAVA